jgi:hypothetical protein
MTGDRESTFAERGTWKPGDLREVGDEIVTAEELASLDDEELVRLLMERGSLSEDRACEALAILRGNIPDGTTV